MFYDITIIQFSKMLRNLRAILDAGAEFAESKNIDFDILLNSRLSADQFNLIRQVQIACDTAKNATARLSDKYESVPRFEDTETNLAELHHRIDSVLEYLNSFSPEDFDHADTIHISQERWKGKYLTGHEYIIQHTLPNLYFHITTAYAILRHHGVDVGKKVYLGPLPYKT